jgi:hypothetical protein
MTLSTKSTLLPSFHIIHAWRNEMTRPAWLDKNVQKETVAVSVLLTVVTYISEEVEIKLFFIEASVSPASDDL